MIWGYHYFWKHPTSVLKQHHRANKWILFFHTLSCHTPNQSWQLIVMIHQWKPVKILAELIKWKDFEAKKMMWFLPFLKLIAHACQVQKPFWKRTCSSCLPFIRFFEGNHKKLLVSGMGLVNSELITCCSMHPLDPLVWIPVKSPGCPRHLQTDDWVTSDRSLWLKRHPKFPQKGWF